MCVDFLTENVFFLVLAKNLLFGDCIVDLRCFLLSLKYELRFIQTQPMNN